MGLAKTIGVFRLTRDSELKYTQNGSAILKLGLACSEKFGDKETQLFLDATAFGKAAEVISQYAGQKGNQLFIVAKQQTESWEKEGVKQYKNSLIIESFEFIGGVNGKQEQQSPQIQHEKHTDYKVPPKQPMPAGTLPIDEYQDQIPF